MSMFPPCRTGAGGVVGADACAINRTAPTRLLKIVISPPEYIHATVAAVYDRRRCRMFANVTGHIPATVDAVEQLHRVRHRRRLKYSKTRACPLLAHVRPHRSALAP